MRARKSGNVWELQSEEWKPSWLPDSRFQSVDLMASSELIRRDFETEKVPGDLS